MKVPVTYQGAKGRLAAEIVGLLGLPSALAFNDLCCGSGAVSIAAVNVGQDPRTITMVDASPWGMFWRAIGDGSFDVDRCTSILRVVPQDPKAVKGHVEALYRGAIDDDAVYNFLVLQAAAIGGSQVWIDGNRWRRSSGFRDYWLPTATSSRRSPVNPMMPMPDGILARVTEIAAGMRGVRGLHVDVSGFVGDGITYIDPPYEGTTGYAFSLDVAKVASRCTGVVAVSEGRALSPRAVLLSSGREKGGITGERKREPNQEWLSFVSSPGQLLLEVS